MGFGGEDRGGVYHSVYDDFYWFTHFSDTAFVYERALAQAAGTTMMRLADADVLPYSFTNLAATTQTYLNQLKQLRDSRDEEITATNHNIDAGVYAAISDPRDPTLAPKREVPPPHFDFAPLEDAVDSLTHAAARYDRALNGALGQRSGVTLASSGPDAATLRDVNEKLLQSERDLLASDGLRGRPWYKHLLYAPGYYTGYGVKTMPGVREALEQDEWSDVNGEIARVAAALNREATLVASLATELGSGGR
jgi:N-acetylated-alpha-linked acidic dipeptidase